MTRVQRTRIILAGGVLAAVLAAVLILATQQGGRPAPATGGIPQQGTSMGSPNAPVLIEEFSDFQCPFCARFYREIEPRIIQEYVAAGQVRFVYRHFAFIGPESVWAAQASECAAAQDRFWDYHHKLFANQTGENAGAFTADRLKGFARDLGLNLDAFSSCLDNNETLDKVRRDTEEAQRLGVRSTPTFFIGGAPLVGALPYEQFKAAIDSKLAD